MVTIRMKRKPGLVGRLGLSLFFAVFLAFGLFFLVMMGIEVRNIASIYLFWKQAPATIITSSVEEKRGEDPYHPAVKFRYEWNGQSYESTRFSSSSHASADYAKARDNIASLPAGASTVCYVDPGDPAAAILRRPEPWMGFFLVIPLIFVAVGGWGIYGAWSGDSGQSKPVRAPNRRGGRLVSVVFGGVFAAVGGGLLVFWYLPSLARSISSMHWVETPCTIVSSRVKSHSDSDGTTYSVDILYRYTFEGTEYKSNRYGMFGGSSSGYRGKARIVERYPAGSQRVCFVDPTRPSASALKPGVGWEALLGLFPLVFLGIGLSVMFWGGRQPAPSAVAVPVPVPAGPLKPRASPFLRFAMTLGVALFWNGIVSVFLWDVVEGFLHGEPAWFETLFLTPFVVVGIGLLGAAGHAFLALTNPRCTVLVDPPAVRAGDTIQISWTCTGSTGRLQRLRIFLEGREEATYRRGTSNVTDRHVFARFPVAEVTQGLEIVQGNARCSMPDRIPPTFSSPSNRILWLIRVHGDIPRWPDVSEEYELPVLGERP